MDAVAIHPRSAEWPSDSNGTLVSGIFRPNGRRWPMQKIAIDALRHQAGSTQAGTTSTPSFTTFVTTYVK